MLNHTNDHKISDPDWTDPERAVASLQGIAAAWLLVLGVALVALLPDVLSVAHASAVRTAEVARSEIAQVLGRGPEAPQDPCA